MQKLNYGKDYNYAGTRLRHSVILNDSDQPVYVSGIDESEGIVFVENVGNASVQNFLLEDATLEPMKLGYANRGRRCVWASRAPLRYYKQGLTGESLRCIPSATLSISSEAIRKTILGVYPSLNSCLETVMNEESDAMAFSRDFALVSNKIAGKDVGVSQLEYRGSDIVGSVIWHEDVNEVHVKLDEEFSYLKECLEESINA